MTDIQPLATNKRFKGMKMLECNQFKVTVFLLSICFAMLLFWVMNSQKGLFAHCYYLSILLLYFHVDAVRIVRARTQL